MAEKSRLGAPGGKGEGGVGWAFGENFGDASCYIWNG